MSIRISLKGITIRLVELQDAEFILSLRTNDQLSRHLNKTTSDLQAQLSWLELYKKREDQGKEFYFIIEDQYTSEAYGTIRVYNLTDREFTSGSWIVKKGSHEEVAFISDYLITFFGFEILRYPTCFFDVRKNNSKVVAFHKRFAIQVEEDAENLYMIMNVDGYHRKKEFYKMLLNTDLEPEVNETSSEHQA